MNAVQVLEPAIKAQRYGAISYTAFRIVQGLDGGRSYPLDIGKPESLTAAVAAAQIHCHHKEHLAIRESGVRLRQWANGAEEVPVGRVHLYQIKRKSQARYEGAFGERRVHDLYAEPVCDFAGEVFA